MNIEAAPKEAMSIDGALGVSLVDWESGMSLGAVGGGKYLDLDVAAAGNTEVIRAKMTDAVGHKPVGLGREWWQGGDVGTRLVHIVVDANDPGRLARFWAAALGWVVADETPEEVDVWPAGFSYPDPVALPLVFVPVPEPKTTLNRVHLDLATTSPEHQQAEVRRLLTLGATHADIGQGDVPWTVLADPEGNEFCVLEPRPVYAGTGPVAAVVAGCADPAALAGFWELAAGFTRVHSEDGFESLRSPAEAGPFLELLRVPDAKTVKNRVHLDVRPHAGEDQAQAVAALRAAGASPADVGQGDVGWTVLADPEGNEFCVLTPR